MQFFDNKITFVNLRSCYQYPNVICLLSNRFDSIWFCEHNHHFHVLCLMNALKETSFTLNVSFLPLCPVSCHQPLSLLFYSYHPLYNSFILYLAFLCSYIHPRSFFHMTFITPHDVPVTTLTSSTFPSFSNFLWGTHSFLSLHTSIHLSFASPLTLLLNRPFGSPTL